MLGAHYLASSFLLLMLNLMSVIYYTLTLNYLNQFLVYLLNSLEIESLSSIS